MLPANSNRLYIKSYNLLTCNGKSITLLVWSQPGSGFPGLCSLSSILPCCPQRAKQNPEGGNAGASSNLPCWMILG